MGASASVSASSVAERVDRSYTEIRQEVEKGNDVQELARITCEESVEPLEEGLHELAARKDHATLQRIIDEIVYIAQQAGFESEAHASVLNVAAGVCLCSADETLRNRSNDLLVDCFNYVSTEQFPRQYAYLLMLYYAFRMDQGDNYEAGWARDTLWGLLETNQQRNDDKHFSLKKLRYRLQNLAVVHRQQEASRGAELFHMLEQDLLGAESPEDDSASLAQSMSTPAMHSAEPLSTRSATMRTASFASLENTPKSVASTPQHGGTRAVTFSFDDTAAAGSGDQGMWDDASSTGTWHRSDSGWSEGNRSQESDSPEMLELQRVLFDMALSCFDSMDEDTLVDATRETLDSCSHAQLIDTLTRCNDQGDTLLLAACRVQNAAVAKILLDSARRVRKTLDLTPQLLGARNAIGLTPLHVAVHSNHASYDVAEVLLSYGGAAICFATDRAGCTPLHYAAATGEPRIVANLLVHGASPLHKDRQGYLAVDYCDPSNTEVFNMLYSAAKDSNTSENDESEPTQVRAAEDELLNSENAWERRVDAASKRVYFYNRTSGEVSFGENPDATSNGGSLSDEALLDMFTNLAWRCGLQGMMRKRKSQATQFAITQARAKLCLIEKGEAAQESLRRVIDLKDRSLEELQRELEGATQDKVMTQERLEQLLSDLAEERAKRQAENIIVYTEEMVNSLAERLEEGQDQRENLTLQLASADADLETLRTREEEEGGLTDDERARKAKLEKIRPSIAAKLKQNASQMSHLAQELSRASASKTLAETTITRIRDLLIKEEELRAQALAKAAQLEEQNRLMRKANAALAEEKQAMESKLAEERRHLQEAEAQRQQQHELLASAENQLSDLQSALSAEQRERNAAKAELDRIRKEMQDLSAERRHDAETLQQQEAAALKRLQDSENEAENLKTRLDDAQKAKDDALARLEALQQKLEEERQYRAKAKKALDGMSKRLNNANQELSLLNKHLENEQKQRERAANELASVQAEMDRLRASHAMNMNQSEEQAKRAAEQSAALAKREQQLASDLAAYESDIAKLNRELMMANFKSSEAAEELEKYKRNLEEERKKRVQAKLQLGSVNAKLEHLQDERKQEEQKWRQELSETQQARAHLDSERQRLERELDRERAEREAREKAIEEAREAALAQEAELRQEAERAAAASKATAEAKDAAEQEMEVLRARLEQARLESEARDAELRELREKDAEKLQQEKEHLLKRLRQEQNWRQEAIDQLADTNEKLNEERRLRKQQLDDEVNTLQEKLRAEAEEKARHQEELDRVMHDMQSLRAQRDQEADQTAEEAAKAEELAQKEAELQAKMREMEEHMARLERERGQLYNEFVEEQALRKQYFNEIEDLKGRIRVFCRVRPMSDSEKERKCVSTIKVLDDMHVRLQHVEEKAPNGLPRRKKPDIEFAFDACFGPEKTQHEVFADVKRLVQVAIDGYNVCVFAYGQTGSGKTFTLMGSAANMKNPSPRDAEEKKSAGEDAGNEVPTAALDVGAGVATRSIHELFRLMDRDSARFRFEVSMYVIELYKEDMVDLLHEFSEEELKNSIEPPKPPPLSVHLDPQGIVDVENITKLPVSSAQETMQGLHKAFQKRKVTATKMNSQSSRSHLVCSLLIKSTAVASGVVTNGKLTLVDLAGSERASKTGATGDTLKEAQAINKSLLALGDVIQALTTNAKHVPYRNHPLTQLMSDSIGGNAKTLMFVNVSPADYNLTETKESLRWAARAKQVTNNSSKNTETAQVRALKEQLERLKRAQGTLSPLPEDAPASATSKNTSRKPSARGPMESLRDLQPPPTSHAATRQRLRRQAPPPRK
ncbi:Kinesin-like protein KIN-14E [Hondaea fermentalgiana]|uniref:Kinesin-like protein KIN-14E n=1 Tax=Hondaea fermentalgiana TaxID=2315210 RepID=A0A2R5GMN7_9STRA|nr:Kinesin-like protein KIN-14E [Hondaea fermentalgiana]|eukprot:GBG30998.1 Kinesin-like protein KIN-14E [Hondaea fermentalgiana]